MTDSIHIQKLKLRKKIKFERTQIPTDVFNARGLLIKNHLLSLITNRNITTIHCFISIKRLFEVDTYALINELLLLGKNVIVPIMNSDELSHSELISLEEINLNQWGVMEPKTRICTNLDTIEIILVPSLALDKKGNRLGYGKGYYDKFLTSIKALKIGLVFEDFVYDTIPFDNHDVKLNGFVTEKGIQLLQP